jgi:hypothetical protein
MNKVILMMLLAVVTSGCSKPAGWSKAGGDKNYTLYVDQSTFVKNGDKVKIWTMYDFNIPQTIEVNSGKSMLVLSRKLQSEYDCKERKTQLLSIVAYSQNMGKGENAEFPVIPKFVSVAPATVSENLLKIACGEISL